MALIEVDRTTYQKAVACPPKYIGGKWYYYGWHPRHSNPLPTRILVHTTNGNKGTRFEAEASFLHTAKLVGAHYLVGKEGQCCRFLTPKTDVAWHAGTVLAGWDNNRTIGIEMHYTPGEAISHTQIEACGRLILDLCAVYPIGDLLTHMALHRHVALPDGRKVDASNMSNPYFDGWRDSLQVRRRQLGI